VIRRYRIADGIVGYSAGDVLISDAGEVSVAVRDGRGICLAPASVGLLGLSSGAQEALRAAGCGDGQVAADLLRVAEGDAAQVLEHCLDGAEGDDVIAGWTEYVERLEALAEVAQ
jgi:hypothetical protein